MVDRNKPAEFISSRSGGDQTELIQVSNN